MNKRTYKGIIGRLKALIGLVLMLSFVVHFNMSRACANTPSGYDKLTSSDQISVVFKDGISTNLEVRAILPKNLIVSYTINGKTTTTTDFEMVDDIVAPLKGDYTITIKLGSVTKVVVAALNISNSESLDLYLNDQIENGNIKFQLDGITLNTTETDLIKYALTEDEIQKVLEGNSLSFLIEIDTDNDEINRETDGGKAIQGLINGSNKASYFKLSLIKVIDGKKIYVNELTKAISITFDLPKTLLEKSSNFSILASHTLEDGTIETFELKDMDSENETYTIVTSKFCTMAFVYEDSELTSSELTSSDLVVDNSSNNTYANVTNEITYNVPVTFDNKLDFHLLLAVSFISLLVVIIKFKAKLN